MDAYREALAHIERRLADPLAPIAEEGKEEILNILREGGPMGFVCDRIRALILAAPPADEEREKALDELISDGCPTVDDYWKNCLCTDCVAFREKRTLILAAPQKKVMPHDAKVTRKEREVILEKCGGDWTRCPLGEAEEDEVEGE
jgi:hypothetical protein